VTRGTEILAGQAFLDIHPKKPYINTEILSSLRVSYATKFE
jgi:hypothetical protein